MEKPASLLQHHCGRRRAAANAIRARCWGMIVEGDKRRVRIAILSDVHGNLPALEAALAAIEREGCDAIYHTGDVIGIGPYPAECILLILDRPHIRLIMGNHDAWFVHGLPQPRPTWMTKGELAHHQWVHAQLDPSLRSVVARWPYVIQEQISGVRVVFTHYGPDDSGRGFVPVIRDARPEDLDGMFGEYDADVVFYEHHHPLADLQGRARYVNPGSLGCHTEPLARFLILDCANDTYTVQHRAVPYDDRPLFAAFEDRAVPERETIRRIFFGKVV